MTQVNPTKYLDTTNTSVYIAAILEAAHQWGRYYQANELGDPSKSTLCFP